MSVLNPSTQNEHEFTIHYDAVFFHFLSLSHTNAHTPTHIFVRQIQSLKCFCEKIYSSVNGMFVLGQSKEKESE